jgi:hypothetical protein
MGLVRNHAHFSGRVAVAISNYSRNPAGEPGLLGEQLQPMLSSKRPRRSRLFLPLQMTQLAAGS